MNAAAAAATAPSANVSATRHKAEHSALTDAMAAWEATDPERARMISAVLRYRAAWRELAEALEDCDRRELWKRWGFESFEAYCTDELRLSKSTLTRYRNALSFLRDFDVPPGAGVPLQSVEVARQALEAGQSGEIPAEQAGDLVTRALEGEEGPRQLADELQQARRGFEPRLFGSSSGPDAVALAKARKACARLEAATRPLREQLPAHVLNALQVVAAYLSAPEPQDDRADPKAEPHAPPAVLDGGDLASAPDGPIPYALVPEAQLVDQVPKQQPGGEPSAGPTFETSAEVAAGPEPVGDPAAPPPAGGETVYEREDAAPAAATPQGQELLRRCNELLWLSSRTSLEDLAPVRAELSGRLAQLSEQDRKALKAALGTERWEQLTAALSGPEHEEQTIQEAEIVYDDE